MTTISQPPILNGTEKQQIVQIRQYLYQISRDLNMALSNLTSENFANDSDVKKALVGENAEQQKQEVKRQLSSLKSLIIKTADTVRAEIDVLETNLDSTYVAQSTYGTFTEEIHGQLKAMADSIEQNIQYSATLQDDLNGVSDAFDQYVVETNGYIKQGIIGYNDATPIIGIAIGQDIKTAGTGTKDGKTYDIIDVSSNMSIWTPEKLAFYVNGSEAAYVSNGAFYVNNIVLTGTLFLDNKWAISFEKGFSIRWIGG